MGWIQGYHGTNSVLHPPRMITHSNKSKAQRHYCIDAILHTSGIAKFACSCSVETTRGRTMCGRPRKRKETSSSPTKQEVVQNTVVTTLQMSGLVYPSSSWRSQTLLCFREYVTVTCVAANIIPIVRPRRYKFRFLLLIALTAQEVGRRGEPM